MVEGGLPSQGASHHDCPIEQIGAGAVVHAVGVAAGAVGEAGEAGSACGVNASHRITIVTIHGKSSP